MTEIKEYNSIQVTDNGYHSVCLQESHLFWSPTVEVKAQRLRRFTVPVDHQEDMESERYAEAVFEW